MSDEHQKGRAVPTATKTIDLTERQRAIVAQIQADEATLTRLREQEDTVLARLNANRGKLELIFELAAQYGDQSQNGGEDASATE